ncbi:MAG TPA: glycosyltransferase family 2 protein [Patescibacteria group bacterium]|nr:glycosyltransferase family 2 protein [Patescibacteria group bacterium]
MGNERTLIVVPAFNEQHNILRVIADIRKDIPGADILVINDCSGDNTAERARAAGAQVVDLPYNLGIGGAVQTGFKYACAHQYDYVVQIDGDGQHIPAEVRKLRLAMERTGSDMVIGSRFLNVHSFKTTCCRRLGIRFFYWLFLVLLHIRVTDSTSGFRLYNKKCIGVLARHYPSDYPEPDAIVLLKKQGLNISETGVEMRARQHGESSITAWKSPYYMLKVSLSILFSCSRTRC